jgi:hypothetical protein
MNIPFTTTADRPLVIARPSPAWCAPASVQQDVSSVAVYERLADVPYCWDALTETAQPTLQRRILRAIEAAPPADTKPIYLVFHENKQPIGVAYCQLIDFKASESISSKPLGNEKECLFTSLGKYFKAFVSKKVQFHTLVCGNLLLTGEHTHAFRADIAPERAFKILSNGVEIAREALEQQLKIDIKITLFKEFFETTIAHTTALREQYAYEFTVQPSMIFHLNPTWKTIDDYMAAISSKYRMRAKRAFKKMNGLDCRDLDLTDLEQYQDDMHLLYQAVRNTAEFNLIYLQKQYFTTLKKHLQDDFLVKGYFEQGKMVGFITALRNGKEMEAHFLGLDDRFNASHQLYLNMLFELLRIGFDWQSETIVYARTALEIKSSIGAKPYVMYNYLRHKNPLSSKMLKSLFQYLQPTPPVWQPRHPFSSEEE